MVPIFRLALVRLPDFRRLGASVLLNSVGMMGETVVLGSLGVGAIIARLGSGAAYLAVASGFLAGALVLLPASSPPRAIPPARGSLWASVVGFATAMRTDRPLLVLMMLTAAAEVLGFSH